MASNGYVRQSAAGITDTSVIYAALFNNEYNALAIAFDATTGHVHDGSTAQGGRILVIGPAGEFVAGSTSLLPKTSAAIDLGSATFLFRDAFLSRNAAIGGNLTVTGTAAITSNATVAGTLGVTGAATLSTLAVTSNATIGGTLGVTGNATMAGTLAVTGTVSGANATTALHLVNQQTADARYLQIAGTQTVTGTTTFNNAVTVGNATVGGHAVNRTTGDARYAQLATANTFTNNLTIGATSPTIIMDRAAGFTTQILGRTGGLNRFGIFPANASAEGGSNTGSNFAINRYDDTGTLIDTPFFINRSTGIINFSVNPTVATNALWHAGNFNPSNYQLALGYTPVQQGTGLFQNTNNLVKIGWSAAARLKATVDTTDLGNIVFDNHLAAYLPLAGGTLTGDLTTYRSASPTTGGIFFGNFGGRYLFFDGANYVLGGAGTIWHTGNITPLSTGGGTITGSLTVNSSLVVLGSTGLQAISGTSCVLSSVLTCLPPRGGGAPGRAMVDSTNRFGPWGWNDTGGYIQVDVDGSAFGINVFVSDERRKDDIAPALDPVLPLIRQIEFINFRFKPAPAAPAETVMPYQRGGLSAQQIRPIREEWVTDLEDGTMMPNIQLLLTNALKGLQELDQEVQALRAEIAELRASPT